MGNTLIDMRDQMFGRLLPLSRAANQGRGTRWLCRCSCGREKVVLASNLRRGLVVSCGCYSRRPRAIRVEVTCANCGEKRLMAPTKIPRFCSRECRYPGDLAFRFWAKVRKGDACWMWQASGGPRSQYGHQYGQFNLHGVPRLAHRVAWELTYGPIPKGLCVCHRCDTPGCVRPDHLFLGTALDNARDRIKKGRPLRNPSVKLTEDAVRAIRRLVAEGMTQTEAGARFRVTGGSVSRIVTGHHWRHVS
jgi:hypothetical protein